MPITHRDDADALRPGLIILIGVAAIALVLLTILLLPSPSIRTVAERLIPPGTLIVSELNYGDLIGMSGSTEASLVDVAEFYRKELRLGRGAIVGSGISVWFDGGLFGRFRSGATMPYTTEGFVILVRTRNELSAVIASRATNENTTSIEVFCERKSARQQPGGNRATLFGPPNAKAGSTAFSLLTSAAMFTTPSALTNISAYYFTNVLQASLPFPTNWAISPTGSGMVLIPKRAGAESATFLLRSNINETVLIHCFRSGTSTQTHILVGCATH